MFLFENYTVIAGYILCFIVFVTFSIVSIKNKDKTLFKNTLVVYLFSLFPPFAVLAIVVAMISLLVGIISFIVMYVNDFIDKMFSE